MFDVRPLDLLGYGLLGVATVFFALSIYYVGRIRGDPRLGTRAYIRKLNRDIYRGEPAFGKEAGFRRKAVVFAGLGIGSVFLLAMISQYLKT